MGTTGADAWAERDEGSVQGVGAVVGERPGEAVAAAVLVVGEVSDEEVLPCGSVVKAAVA